jgi:hypothetical protein
MTDETIGRYLTLHPFIGYPMGAQLPSVIGRDDTVPISIARALPGPARIWFAWLVEIKKAVGERSRAGGIATSFRTIIAALSTWWTQVAMLAQSDWHSLILSRMNYVTNGAWS